MPVKNICEKYNVGKSTVYDIVKQKQQIRDKFATSDSKKLTTERKNLIKAKHDNLDTVLYAWFKSKTK